MVENIISIYDENDNEIKFNHLEIKTEKSKRSTTYSKILYIDNIPIKGENRNLYKVLYRCNCGNLSKVALKYYLGKLEIHCNKCSNRNNVKHYENIIKQKDNRKFEEYDNDFINKYWIRHLHKDEFYKWISYIYQINDKKISDYNINNIIYYEHEKCYNQQKFVSKISFDNGQTLENLKSIYLKCNICNKIFKIKPFNIRRKNIEDIRCQKCNFWTKSYKIQFYKDTNITYQSELEKTFLDLCFKNNIEVINGFEIPYYFKNKLHTYVVDFYLPQLKYLVEIKGSNPYFIKDLQSGRIEAKNAYAANFCKENNMHFRFIRDYDLEKFIKNIVNKL